MRELFNQRGHLLAQRPRIHATVGVNHGHLPLRAGFNQLIEEANHRGHADTRREKVEGCIRRAEALQGEVTVRVGNLDNIANREPVNDRSHFAVRVELYADTALVFIGRKQGVLAGLAQTITCLRNNGNVLACFRLSHRGVIGRLKSQHNHVIAGLLAINNFEGRVGNIIRLGRVQAPLDLNEGVRHEPVHFAPGVHDLLGCGIAQVCSNRLKKILIYGGVLFLLQPQRSVLMRHAGKYLIGVGIGMLHNVGGKNRNRPGKCFRLGALKLRRTGEQAVHQIGSGSEHPLVEVRGNVTDTVGDNGQCCLNNGT